MERQNSDSVNQDRELKRKVIALSEVSMARQLYSLAFDWFFIALSIGLASYFANALVSFVAIVFIASRQHALLVMMHEASHFRISRNTKVNDFISDILAAYPTLMSTKWYRQHHLAHHRFTNTDADPDWARKVSLEEWKFPKTKSQIAKLLFKKLFVGGFEWMVLIKKISGSDWKKATYWAVVFTAAISTGQLRALLFFWFVPLLTFFPIFQLIRSISEHFGLSYETELSQTRDIESNSVEKFLFGPHNVHYHLTHHLFPSVPQYNLKKLNRELSLNQKFKETSQQNDGYVMGKNTVLQDLTSPQKVLPETSSIPPLKRAN